MESSSGPICRGRQSDDGGGLLPMASGQRGSSSVEFAVLFPIIVGLLLAGPQLGLWYFAREAAESAALAGARAGSAASATADTGRQVAADYLAELGSGTITSYSVEEVISETTVSVHVVASIPNVIPLPGFDPTVDVAVEQGRERFTTADAP